MILLINQGCIKLGFTMENKANDCMTQHMTMGLGHITPKLNRTYGLYAEGSFIVAS